MSTRGTVAKVRALAVTVVAVFIAGLSPGAAFAGEEDGRAQGANALYDAMVRTRAVNRAQKTAAPIGAERLDTLKRVNRDAAISEALESEQRAADDHAREPKRVRRRTEFGGASESVARKPRQSKKTVTETADSLADLEQAPEVTESESPTSRTRRARAPRPARPSRISRGAAEREADPVLDATGLEPVIDFSGGDLSGGAKPKSEIKH